MSERERADSEKSEGTVGKESRRPVSGGRLLRSTSWVSSMTLLSRILGLARDVVFARVFGAKEVTDAFFVAFKIPNMLRRFSGEGAFSQGFVPVMGRYREQHTHEQAREFIDAVAGTFGLLLFAVTAIGVVAAPVLVMLVAPGFVDDQGQFDLTTAMVRFTFPYIFFISLVAFAGGILNTYGKFAVPAFTPVILNVVLISFALYVAPRSTNPGMALAYGVFVAGAVQLLFQLPFLARIKALPRPKWRPGHAGVRRAGRLMVPALFGSSVAQINVVIGSIIASMLGAGKISYIYYSDRLMEFPLGLFGIALATVTLPYLSRQFAAGLNDEFSATLDWSLKLAFLLVIPSAVGLAVLAEPLVATIFYGGEFDRHALDMTAISLQAFAAGLVGFALVKILAPAFFARENTRTPVRIALIALIVNVVLSLLLAWQLTIRGFDANHAGLALATSIAAIVNACLLYWKLRGEGIIVHGPGWPILLFRITVAVMAMIAVLQWLAQPTGFWTGEDIWGRIWWLGVSVSAGATTYFVVLLALGLRPTQFRLID